HRRARRGIALDQRCKSISAGFVSFRRSQAIGLRSRRNPPRHRGAVATEVHRHSDLTVIEPTAPTIPDDLRALMAQVGPHWASDIPGNVRLMIRSFDPVLAKAPKDGISVRTDIAYGEHPRQRLDV